MTILHNSIQYKDISGVHGLPHITDKCFPDHECRDERYGLDTPTFLFVNCYLLELLFPSSACYQYLEQVLAFSWSHFDLVFGKYRSFPSQKLLRLGAYITVVDNMVIH